MFSTKAAPYFGRRWVESLDALPEAPSEKEEEGVNAHVGKRKEP